MLREICFLSLKCHSMGGRNFCMLKVKCKIPKIVSQYRRILKAFMCVPCRIYFCVHLYSACIHCGPWPCVTLASKYFPLHRLNHLCGTFNHTQPHLTKLYNLCGTGKGWLSLSTLPLWMVKWSFQWISGIEGEQDYYG